jgi:sulfite reductase (ferredoxin)
MQEARHDTHYARPEDVEEFVRVLEAFERSELTAEDFRAFRLTRGVYGQRQKDVNMLRIKLPWRDPQRRRPARLREHRP